jgi:hypothetical protein
MKRPSGYRKAQTQPSATPIATAIAMREPRERGFPPMVPPPRGIRGPWRPAIPEISPADGDEIGQEEGFRVFFPFLLLWRGENEERGIRK